MHNLIFCFIRSIQVKTNKYILSSINIKMTENCHVLDCINGCCNQYGSCPASYDSYYYDSSYTSCAYYYSTDPGSEGDSSSSGGAAWAAVVEVLQEEQQLQ